MSNFGNVEIISIVEAVAREKNISKDSVFGALEEAIRVAARKKYGQETSVVAEIDRRTGDIKILRKMLVVADDYEPVEEVIEEGTDETKKEVINPIAISDAKHKKEDAQIGDIIFEQLPPIDLGRVAAQSAKQVITYKVKEIEREQNYEESKLELVR